MDPDHAAIPGEEAIFGAEMLAHGAGLRELGMPAIAVVGVELPVPEDRVLQPFFLGEAQQRLDLRADVQLVVSVLESGHERDGRKLLDQGAIAGLGPADLLLLARAPIARRRRRPRIAGGRRMASGAVVRSVRRRPAAARMPSACRGQASAALRSDERRPDECPLARAG